MSVTPVRLDRAPPHVDQDREDVLALLEDLEKKRPPEGVHNKFEVDGR
jgi:hypothetical protein